jgi:ABC-type uncharacterized transport system involved in gliding motility auxiliary subunit
VFDLKKGFPDASMIDAMIIVKPTKAFTEEDKLKIDQYILHCGKLIWCIDKLYAELDSLKRNQAEYTAFDRGLDLDDLLFKYGVRINGDLLQDLNCSKDTSFNVIRGFKIPPLTRRGHIGHFAWHLLVTSK